MRRKARLRLQRFKPEYDSRRPRAVWRTRKCARLRSLIRVVMCSACVLSKSLLEAYIDGLGCSTATGSAGTAQQHARGCHAVRVIDGAGDAAAAAAGAPRSVTSKCDDECAVEGAFASRDASLAGGPTAAAASDVASPSGAVSGDDASSQDGEDAVRAPEAKRGRLDVAMHASRGTMICVLCNTALSSAWTYGRHLEACFVRVRGSAAAARARGRLTGRVSVRVLVVGPRWR